jgi:hypothetical protein
MDLQKLKFPVGVYEPDRSPSHEQLQLWIQDIESFPSRLEELIQGLGTEELNWRYRPEGWKLKQVIHHCADSHINSLMRFKLALTEEHPSIRPYYEDRWAELIDSQDDDVEPSLDLLHGLHKRWTQLLKSLNEDQLKREFVHPEHGQSFNLAETIGNYAWHCNHHLAHVRNAIESGGSFN